MQIHFRTRHQLWTNIGCTITHTSSKPYPCRLAFAPHIFRWINCSFALSRYFSPYCYCNWQRSPLRSSMKLNRIQHSTPIIVNRFFARFEWSGTRALKNYVLWLYILRTIPCLASSLSYTNVLIGNVGRLCVCTLHGLCVVFFVSMNCSWIQAKWHEWMNGKLYPVMLRVSLPFFVVFFSHTQSRLVFSRFT